MRVDDTAGGIDQALHGGGAHAAIRAAVGRAAGGRADGGQAGDHAGGGGGGLRALRPRALHHHAGPHLRHASATHIRHVIHRNNA